MGNSLCRPSVLMEKTIDVIGQIEFSRGIVIEGNIQEEYRILYAYIKGKYYWIYVVCLLRQAVIAHWFLKRLESVSVSVSVSRWLQKVFRNYSPLGGFLHTIAHCLLYIFLVGRTVQFGRKFQSAMVPSEADLAFFQDQFCL